MQFQIQFSIRCYFCFRGKKQNHKFCLWFTTSNIFKHRCRKVFLKLSLSQHKWWNLLSAFTLLGWLNQFEKSKAKVWFGFVYKDSGDLVFYEWRDSLLKVKDVCKKKSKRKEMSFNRIYQELFHFVVLYFNFVDKFLYFIFVAASPFAQLRKFLFKYK